MVAMEGDMSVLEELQKRISSSPDLSPHDVQVQLPTTANNLGTDKGKNILFSLKKRYLLAHLQAGKISICSYPHVQCRIDYCLLARSVRIGLFAFLL